MLDTKIIWKLSIPWVAVLTANAHWNVSFDETEDEWVEAIRRGKVIRVRLRKNTPWITMLSPIMLSCILVRCTRITVVIWRRSQVLISYVYSHIRDHLRTNIHLQPGAVSVDCAADCFLRGGAPPFLPLPVGMVVVARAVTFFLLDYGNELFQLCISLSYSHWVCTDSWWLPIRTVGVAWKATILPWCHYVWNFTNVT